MVKTKYYTHMYSEKPKLHEKQRQYVSGNLRTLALDVTPRCNMKCPHCYSAPFRQAKPVELEVLKKTLDEAHSLGVFHYILLGGEPLVDCERLEAIISLCHPEESFINVVSNGWYMTMDKILWLKELKVDKIAFSLDSGIAEEHDVNRKPGSFQRVMEAIDNVLRAELLTSISITVTHDTLYTSGFKKAYAYAQTKNIRVELQIAMPVGRWDGRREVLMTLKDSQYIKKLQEECSVLPDGQKMLHRDIFCGDTDHCPAGTEFIAISADGKLLPCNFLQFSLGSIQDKTLFEMRRDILTCAWFDGKHGNCIAGEDDTFIDTFITPYINHTKPLNAYDVFGLNEVIKMTV